MTNYITNFQSVSEVLSDVPDIIYKLISKISNQFNLPSNNVFLQVLDMNKGGKINPHYDASISGYINYKCNNIIISMTFKRFIQFIIVLILLTAFLKLLFINVLCLGKLFKFFK